MGDLDVHGRNAGKRSVRMPERHGNGQGELAGGGIDNGEPGKGH